MANASGNSGPFELSGGALCLDFANTWADRSRPESDGLGSFDDWIAFVGQAGLAAVGERSRLAAAAARRPREAARALAAARTLRERLYRIFSARAGRRPIPAADLEALNADLGPALALLELARAGDRFAWRFRSAGGELDGPLAPVVRSAAELLVSNELGRVRECDGERCNWLFLDRSRAGSRRWCSMASCGNRAKARRHYHRARAGD